MKNLFRSLAILFIMIIVNTVPIYAANLELTGSPTIVSKILPNQGDIYYGYGTLGHYIGRKYSADIQETEVNRTLFSFNIAGIPTNATINSVSVNIYFTDYPSSYKAAITYADFQSGPQNQWTEIGSADVLMSDMSYSGGSSFSSTALKNDIQSALGSSEYYLGVFSTNGEITGSTYASVSLQLDIDYTVPPSQVDITIQNNFIYGTIKVGVDQSATQGPSPYPITPTVGNTVNVEAQDQPYGGYDWIWNDTEAELYRSEWEQKYSDGHSESRGISESISRISSVDDNNSTFIANLRKVCNISFSNQFSGTNYGGQIKVNGGAWENDPTAQRQVVEQNLITAEAKSRYTINGIQYDFQNWSDGSTSRFGSFNPSSHENYQAIYKGYPLFDEDSQNGSLRNLTITPSGPNNYMKLTWDDHPNTNVTKYYIYRIYRLGSSQSSQQLIGTRNYGNTEFTDYSFEYNPNGEYTLMYDVKAYFAPDGTKSGPNPVWVSGDASNTAYKISSKEEITHYDISNYPNPYNPETTIRFQLPKEGIVTIKVYNSIGEEIKTLLNEQKSYGMYELKFDGNDLPSGMYIYTIKVNDYFASKKMLLIK